MHRCHSPANDEKTYNGNGPGESGPGTQKARVYIVFQKLHIIIKTSAAAAACSSSFASPLPAHSRPQPITVNGEYLFGKLRTISSVPSVSWLCLSDISPVSLAFEFNSRFLRRPFYHHYSCQYGTFLANTEQKVYEDQRIDGFGKDYFRPSRVRQSTVWHRDYRCTFLQLFDVKRWYEL